MPRLEINGGCRSPAIITSTHIAASTVAPWNFPPGSSAPFQSRWMPISRPSGGRSRASKVSASLAGRRGNDPGRPPQASSAATAHTPINAGNSTTDSSRVSMARWASNTPVTGLPRPVGARFSATNGAKVGAGTGSSSTTAPSPAATAAQRSAIDNRSIGPGRRARSAASKGASRATAPSSRIPVRPLPSAASVMATSGADSRNQTSVINRP